MNLVQTSETIIRANTKPIVNELTNLKAELDRLTEKQKDFGRGSKQWKDQAVLIKEAKLAYEDAAKSMGIYGMTMQQLGSYTKMLSNELKSLIPGTDAFVKKASELKDANTYMAELRSQTASTFKVINDSETTWSKLKGWITTAFGVGAILQAGLALKDFFVNGVTNFIDFEKAAASLKGETGLTTVAIDKLKDSALATGNQFGMTGKEMLEGYNAIASGKSDLLLIEGGLQAVTEAAAKLAIDGEMNMKDAANSATESLNQFGKGAQYAEKFVNQLATGTIVGAGKVGEMSEALKKAGPIANAMGLSFGQTNAVLQLFHQNGIKGAEAGTQFKSMMAALLKGADDTNPSIVGLEKAFENLRKKNLSTTETMKLFGSEAVTGGLILTNNTETLKNWTAKIEKGAEGAEMFAAKTADVSFLVKQQKAHLIDVGVAFASNLSGGIRIAIGAFGLLVDGLAGTLKLLIEIPRFIADNKALFMGLASAVLALNTNNIAAIATTLAHAAAERGRAIAVGAMTLAQRALNIAMATNPIAFVITGLSILVGVLVNAYQTSINFRATINGLWASLKVFAVAVKDLFIGLATFDARKIYSTISVLGTNMSKAYNTSYEKETTAFRNAEEDKYNKRKIKELADAKAAAKAKAEAEATEKALENLKSHGTIEKQDKKANEKSLANAKKHQEEMAKLKQEGIDFIEKIAFESIKNQDEKARITIQKQYKDELKEAEKLFSEKAIDFIEYSNLILAITKKRDADLKEQADKVKEEEKKALDEKAKAWNAALKQMDDALEEIEKKEDKDRKEREQKEKDHAKRVADTRRDAIAGLVGVLNDSFNNTIASLESIDTAFAQSQANRIRGIQEGFNTVAAGLKNLKLPLEDIFKFDKSSTDTIAKQFGANLATGLGNAISANPVGFALATAQVLEGIANLINANKWAKFEAPLRKIIDDSIDAIEAMAIQMEVTIARIEADADRLFQKNDANRDKLTADALDYEARQFAQLVKHQEDLNRINAEYLAEELRIKELYATELNNADADRAEKARAIVDALIRDLKESRNNDIEDLINAENEKTAIAAEAANEIAKINKEADEELAEIAKTAADRTIEEQQALIDAVEAKRQLELEKVATERQAELTKLQDYKTQEAEINRLADEALLAAKTNANNLTIAEQQRLVDEIEAKRKIDLQNLATSDIGLLFIKQQTADAIKAIEEAAAAQSFTIEQDLNAKKLEAERQHNIAMWQEQVKAWEAERALTIASLQLQLMKAQGKIFNKRETEIILAALNQAMFALPPAPPAGLFGGGSGGSGNAGGNGSSVGASGGGGSKTPSGEVKFANGGLFEQQTGLSFANGGVIYGPSHAQGGFKVVNSRTGKIAAEMEGGEFIVNKKATAANLALIKRINQSGLAGRLSNSNFSRNGRPYFEDGGVFSTFGPITLNQSNSLATETYNALMNIVKYTGATADAADMTAKNTEATASRVQKLDQIANATQQTANKDFNITLNQITQRLSLAREIKESAEF